jgi:TatD DNase family protein
LIDTHCHLNFDSFDSDRDQVIERAAAAGVTHIIIPAVDVETTQEALALAAHYPSIYAASGVHPNSTADFTADTLNTIAELAQQPKIVAIGEIGLDYHWDKSPKEKQLAAFEAQLELAVQLELPIIIHSREASKDVMAILERWAVTLPDPLKSRPGVMHSFSAPPSIAERALDIGLYLGFTGPITYKNADELRRVAAATPLDRILVETDAPFLVPIPYRGRQQRNEPSYIPIMVERLASLKQVSDDEMARITTENAERLFKLQ